MSKLFNAEDELHLRDKMIEELQIEVVRLTFSAQDTSNLDDIHETEKIMKQKLEVSDCKQRHKKTRD